MPVNLSLGDRDPAKDGECVRFDERGEFAVFEDLTNLAVAAAVRMRMRVCVRM